MKRFLFYLMPFFAIVYFLPFLASIPFCKPIVIAIFEKKLGGKLTLESVDFSWQGPQVFQQVTFQDSLLLASIDTVESEVPFWQLSQLNKSFQIQNGEFSFQDTEKAKLTQVEARIHENRILAVGSTQRGGSFLLKGFMKSKENFEIEADFKEIPSIALDEFSQKKPLFSSLLGQTVSLTGSFLLNQGKGSLLLDLSSSNGKGSIQATIENNQIQLTAPLSASFFITVDGAKEIERHLPAKVATSVHSLDPWTLTIDPNGFLCPILPFSFDQLQIKHGSLNLRRIQLESGNALHFLLKLFKTKAINKNIPIWFTPIDFSLKQGVLSFDRIDALLSDSIHLCTWGDLNLKENQIQMILGIPADTLKNSFNIKDLSSRYVLKIPISGPIDNPSFETGQALAKIATMATSQNLPSTGGKIFGGLVNAFTQSKEEEDVPSPHSPFPWER